MTGGTKQKADKPLPRFFVYGSSLWVMYGEDDGDAYLGGDYVRRSIYKLSELDAMNHMSEISASMADTIVTRWLR